MSRFTIPVSLILALTACKGGDGNDTDTGPGESPSDDSAEPTDDSAEPTDDTSDPNDADGDGYTDDDCDDTDANVNPGADEDPSNGVDDDCDGTVDDAGVGDLSAGDLIVSEIMKDPAAVADNFGEWFEIQNTTKGPIDLEGVSFRDPDESLVLKVYGTHILEAGDWFVFGVSDDKGANGGYVADYDYSYGGFNVGNAGTIVIDANGSELDSADYSDVDFTEGVSIGLVDGTWCDQTSTYGDGDVGTPGAANDTCAADTDDDADGYTADVDCDDDDASVNPGADEIWYDGIDQDCDDNDGDQDGDGFEAEDVGGDDCDDTDASTNPDGTEVWYDGVDQDCDGNDSDFDGDGYESTEVGGDDCDDSDASINPGAEETHYNGIDENCVSDEYDADGDGFDHDSYGGTDCDDADPLVNPAASETWYDGDDDDCDGLSDYDADVDGFDSDLYGGEDCDDTDALVNPDATDDSEDGTDQDCDGTDGAPATDDDGDGYDSTEDCDDGDATINPGATEVWYDGVDQDCDEASDYDADGDGYDSDSYFGTDCDDADPFVNPGASDDSVDGTDQDCDGDDGPTPGDWDESYSGDIEIVVDAGFIGTDTCTGELLVDVDETGTPHIQGIGDCTFTGIVAAATGQATYDVELDGTVSADTASGDIELVDVGDTTWSGSFSGLDPWTLDGSFSGSGKLSGVAFTYEGTFTVETSSSGGGDTGGDTGPDTGPGGDTGDTGDTGEDSLLAALLPGDLIITEIMPNPDAVTDANGEYFEIYNNSGVELDLQGLEIYDDGGDTESIITSTTVDADSYADICVNSDSITNGGFDCDYAGGFNLANTSDELYLAYDGTVFDSVAWDTAGDWTVDAGVSMSLDPDLLDADLNDEADAWCSSSSSYGDGDLGTPGDANDACTVSYTYGYSDIEAIWAADCAYCHTSGGTSGNLNLDAGYASIVDTPSDDVPTMDLIEPGDTASSYLWRKLEGTHKAAGGAGSTMPLGSSTTAGNLDILETWILEGAPE